MTQAAIFALPHSAKATKMEKKENKYVLTNIQRKILHLLAEEKTISEISKIMEMDESKVEGFYNILLQKIKNADLSQLLISESENSQKNQ